MSQTQCRDSRRSHGFCGNSLLHQQRPRRSSASGHSRRKSHPGARRPFRVCGMVRNEGETRRRPYNAFASDGRSVAPQILSLSTDRPLQVRKRRDDEERGYFNPVDLVCYLKRADGKPLRPPRVRRPRHRLHIREVCGGLRPSCTRTTRPLERSYERLEHRLCQVPASTSSTPVKTVQRSSFVPLTNKRGYKTLAGATTSKIVAPARFLNSSS